MMMMMFYYLQHLEPSLALLYPQSLNTQAENVCLQSLYRGHHFKELDPQLSDADQQVD